MQYARRRDREEQKTRQCARIRHDSATRRDDKVYRDETRRERARSNDETYESQVEEELATSLKSFMLARAVSSDAEIEEAISMPTAKVSLETSSKNVMSVNVPVFNVTESETSGLYPYSFASVTSELDSSIASLTTLLPKLLKLAEVEKTSQKSSQNRHSRTQTIEG